MERRDVNVESADECGVDTSTPLVDVCDAVGVTLNDTDQFVPPDMEKRLAWVKSKSSQGDEWFAVLTKDEKNFINIIKPFFDETVFLAEVVCLNKTVTCNPCKTLAKAKRQALFTARLVMESTDKSLRKLNEVFNA